MSEQRKPPKNANDLQQSQQPVARHDQQLNVSAILDNTKQQESEGRILDLLESLQRSSGLSDDDSGNYSQPSSNEIQGLNRVTIEKSDICNTNKFISSLQPLTMRNIIYACARLHDADYEADDSHHVPEKKSVVMTPTSTAMQQKEDKTARADRSLPRGAGGRDKRRSTMFVAASANKRASVRVQKLQTAEETFRKEDSEALKSMISGTRDNTDINMVQSQTLASHKSNVGRLGIWKESQNFNEVYLNHMVKGNIMTYHPHCCACNGQNACCKNCSCVKSGRACVDCLRNDRCANRNSLLPSTTPDYIDTSLFVTLYMKCTASKCSLRTLVKAPFSVDIEFFLKDFLCGQCSAERLHLTKQSVYEAKLAISEVKREICNIQEQLKNCLVRGSLENSKQYGNTISINDDVSNPRISSFAVVVRREVAGSIFATSHLQKELPPLKLLQQCDRESRRSQNVIISGLQNSDSDRELVDELFKELGVKVPLDLNLTLKRNSDPSAVFYICNNRIIKLSKQQYNEKVSDALSVAAPI
ncbi:hypothetical protein GJ496_000166 [Pomphorhynchus laevis]|nr:hypothetical protein GJ496_000166 [Pomphorhynchus laevis]